MGGRQGLVGRVGGVEGLRRILRRFYARLAADPMVGFFFAGRDLGAIVEGQLGFLLWALGEVPQLRVRHPRDAHGGLPPILRGHFDRRLVVLEETLREAGLGDDDIKAWLKIESALRKQVQARNGARPER
jgi:truncated hemoglobin YjbI